MKTYTEKRQLPFTREQMFDLVADVESYGDFLPGWIDATIIEQEEEVVFVEQEVGVGMFHTRFISQVIFTRPDRIEITSTDGPFLYLAVRWIFEPSNHLGCMAHFYAGFELRSRFLERIAGTLFSDLMPRLVSAFDKRARGLYAHAFESGEVRESALE